uniref:Uncharacterized protein n=1 Tax=Ananas comosus var. bracteatus TaxID=296719 RepID=A0A6V7PX50_ANACO|nr:unnamed protein product [Ananas comosus var. bracteatus]
MHYNIYAVLPDKDPGDGMSFIIAKMNEAATKQTVVSQKGKQSVVPQKGKQQKQIKKHQQQQQQQQHDDDFPSQPPPLCSSQCDPQWKTVQKKPRHRSGHGRDRYGENGYSGDRGRRDTTPNLKDGFKFPSLQYGKDGFKFQVSLAAAATKAKKPRA